MCSVALVDMASELVMALQKFVIACRGITEICLHAQKWLLYLPSVV